MSIFGKKLSSFRYGFVLLLSLISTTQAWANCTMIDMSAIKEPAIPKSWECFLNPNYQDEVKQFCEHSRKSETSPMLIGLCQYYYPKKSGLIKTRTLQKRACQTAEREENRANPWLRTACACESGKPAPKFGHEIGPELTRFSNQCVIRRNSGADPAPCLNEAGAPLGNEVRNLADASNQASERTGIDESLLNTLEHKNLNDLQTHSSALIERQKELSGELRNAQKELAKAQNPQIAQHYREKIKSSILSLDKLGDQIRTYDYAIHKKGQNTNRAEEAALARDTEEAGALSPPPAAPPPPPAAEKEEALAQPPAPPPPPPPPAPFAPPPPPGDGAPRATARRAPMNTHNTEAASSAAEPKTQGLLFSAEDLGTTRGKLKDPSSRVRKEKPVIEDPKDRPLVTEQQLRETKLKKAPPRQQLEEGMPCTEEDVTFWNERLAEGVGSQIAKAMAGQWVRDENGNCHRARIMRKVKKIEPK